jgi:hypothetical protein
VKFLAHNIMPSQTPVENSKKRSLQDITISANKENLAKVPKVRPTLHPSQQTFAAIWA